jgi:hypothetical protein
MNPVGGLQDGRKSSGTVSAELAIETYVTEK